MLRMEESLKQPDQQNTHPLVQFIKYALVGGIATVVHIIMFHLAAIYLFPALQTGDWIVKLLHVSISSELSDAVRAKNSMIDNAIAFMISNFVCYVMNVAWVFKAGRHHWIVEIVLFYAVSAISIVLGTMLMGWLISHYGLQTTIAFGANLVTAVLINYACRKYLVFKG
ncbi:MAG: hypothetical protein DSY80_00430 [Desulfocapsa sp.]|nr:MAG: hypothetical protein DSY80_00430 [Desulfocapsa sp.]